MHEKGKPSYIKSSYELRTTKITTKRVKHVKRYLIEAIQKPNKNVKKKQFVKTYY